MRRPIGAIGQGPKLLFLTGVLDGRTITCAPQMRDDVLGSTHQYTDVPVVQDSNLNSRGTEDLPQFMQALVEEYGNQQLLVGR
jgi:putative intracellular protease/amidase